MPIQPVRPIQKKSHKKAIIITLIAIGVIMPTLTILAALLLLPSTRLCAGIAQKGQDVAGIFKDDLTLTSYGYSCLSNDPPTTAGQQISLDYVTPAVFASRDDFASSITDKLVSDGWVRSASDSNESINFTKQTYKLTLTVRSYQPAHASISVRPVTDGLHIGLIFDADPIAQKKLTQAEKLTYSTVPVFAPQFVPTGYSSWEIGTVENDGYQVIRMQGGTGKDAPSLLIQSPVPAGFDITKNCTPNDFDRGVEAECDLLVETPGGIKIYKEHSISRFHGYKTVAIVNGLVVTMDDGYQSPTTTPQLTVVDIAQVYDSIKQIDSPAK